MIRWGVDCRDRADIQDCIEIHPAMASETERLPEVYMAVQQVDERCRERCESLADAVASCESATNEPSKCKDQFKKWRTHCVTNSACNPSGRNADPLRLERKCSALARRVASICETSDGGHCDEHRTRWNSLCSGVAVHDVQEKRPDIRSQAITDQYRTAAKEAQPPEPRGGAIVRLLADQFSAFDQDGHAMSAARAIANRPAMAISTIAGSLSALLLQREAAKPTNSGVTGAQRLMAARVYVQACVVASVVVVIGLAEVVEAVETRRRYFMRPRGGGAGAGGSRSRDVR